MDHRARIEELVRRLNEASEAYYGGKDEIMTNYEWDALFDELSALEQETGIILPDSPTQAVSTAEENGQKEAHEFPALSLAKTKKVEDLQKWAEDKEIFLSWKLDGLTLVATYDNGSITRILTRGNGTVGTNITFMKEAIHGIPQTIGYKGHLVVRGEATISYPDFEAINDSLEEEEEKYANPRNLASGTLSLDVKNLDKVKERNLWFNAFTLVYLDDDIKSWGDRMAFLKKSGFTTVDYEKTNAAGIAAVVEQWTERVERGEMQIPVDGLVVCYDDTEYAATGSVTGHHATRAGLAFKWQDTAAVTILDHVEWSCAASTITPVAVFDPVQLEGTTVSRASLCNLSEIERLGIGADRKTKLQVIKANKIIPKCVAVLEREGECLIPASCPVCGAPTCINESISGTKTLKCTDPQCPAKNLKKYARFVGKDGMDIDGMSIETIRDFVNCHFISGYADIFDLEQHKEEIMTMSGYGEKSCNKLLASIEKSSHVHPAKLIVALNIPLIGVDAAKKIIAATGWRGFLENLEQNIGFETVDGIGAEKSGAILKWYREDGNREQFFELIKRLKVENVEPKAAAEGTCSNLTFVITGDVHLFKNRDAFKAFVEAQGGKVTGSVSKKTQYLVNNDTESMSSKNQKAKELGIPVLSEEMFLERFGSGFVPES